MVWEKATGKPVHNAIVWQDTRTDQICNELAEGRPGPASPEDRSAARDLLLGAEGQVDPRQRRGRPGQGRGGRGPVRQHRHVVHLEPDGWPRRWRARHRRDERQPDDADEPRDAGLGRRDPRRHGDPAGDAARRPSLERCLRARRSATSPASPWPETSATSRQPCSARRASRPVRRRTRTAPACFMLLNTGTSPVPSKSGLLTTLGYKIGDQPAVYCLEGSIAITGALVQWLRDNLGLIGSPRDRGTSPRRWRTTAVSTSSRRSRACSPRTGERRSRRDRGPDPVRQQGPHRAGDPRGDRVADP